ncbi:MAG TPA: efflux RND transporter periplasmic adaptor subunit [Vicinamibacterales bacterium]|nr:efflux RND transporter periplasmic adaptor subunit [Vicinamibacterales bacterium]
MTPMTRYGGAILLSAVLGLAACARTDPPADTPPPLPVSVATVQAIDVAERLEAGGVVGARESATLSSRLMAPVREVRVRAGDRVRAGQVLVVLDGRDLAAQAAQAVSSSDAAGQGLAAAKTELAAAASEHTLATSWHGRIAALHAKHSATAHELEEAEARLAAATARLEGARARVGQAESSTAASRAAVDAATTVRGFATIVAPFDGLVTERFTDPGNLAAPGVPLLRVETTGGQRVEVTIDESRAAFLMPGDRVDVLVGDGSGGTHSAVSGTIADVAREVSAAQRAFRVKVALADASAARTGTFARVRFRGAGRTAVVVPPAAIVRQGQVASAFVLQGELARLRLLHLGDVFDEGVEVLAGLGAGERVVVNPPPGLRDGRRVAEGGAVPAGERR